MFIWPVLLVSAFLCYPCPNTPGGTTYRKISVNYLKIGIYTVENTFIGQSKFFKICTRLHYFTA